MAYYLTIKKGKEYYKLNISSVDRFERFSRFKEEAMSLEEIDNFTTKFKGEVELKTYLFQNGILDADSLIKEISIRRKNKEQLIKVRYGLAYSDDIKYLDIDYLRDKVLSMQGDREFLDKLANYYRDSYSNNSVVYQIRSLLLNKTDESLSLAMALEEFVQREVYNENIFTGEVKIKYKSLHDLGMFVRNYERRFASKMSSKMILEGVKNNLLKMSKEETKVRKRVKKNEQIEGQTSLFEG